MLVVIDTTFKSMNVLWHTQSLKLTCTFLVLTTLLCCTITAALWHRKYSRFLHILSFYAFSFPPLQMFPYPFWVCTASSYIKDVPPIQHEQWTPPSIIQLTCTKTEIYSGNSPWHKTLHIPNVASSNLYRLLIHDMNHYTYQTWQSNINLSVTWTIRHTAYGKAVV